MISPLEDSPNSINLKKLNKTPENSDEESILFRLQKKKVDIPVIP
jgi:hypothetical protein